MKYFVFIVNVLLSLSLELSALSCRDENGAEVEWFIGYKFPNSFHYAYLTPGLQSWKRSSYEINKGGMLKNTYDSMYEIINSSNAMYAMYNDGIPNAVSNGYWWGHMKGAFAFEHPGSGFWVIHSIPKLSAEKGVYKYPASGKVYGQHFFCMTLSSDNLGPIVAQMKIAKPWIQDWYLSPELDGLYPDISKLVRHATKTKINQAIVPFQTIKGGLEMRHFSKSIAFGKDLYDDLVVPTLGVGLNVETWQHGKLEPSACDRPNLEVHNVKRINFEPFAVEFSSYSDHAKWASSSPSNSEQNDNSHWVCLGDINRQFSQFHRGGGTMCVRDETIWKAFTSIIAGVEPCKKE